MMVLSTEDSITINVTWKPEARLKGPEQTRRRRNRLQLKHPNIVETFEYGLTTDNEPYLVMEFSTARR